ncbi:uncharacterized protein YuzE [Rhodococcus erythropolis]|uniref:DUF2283 domain-containing protein n=1 Tax=Rhodococcus erythropolis TaxID=1833 RepID=UPI002167E901|nr:DUF2283 domain-containing protein [Rhodococcus erythropolis]MCS4255812.1 uncharacterized protein YuzE [Rhodococcus erythropolis]MCW2425329.1 uncharacterized protein YuzE [Rhodococcus erythropolis]
MHLTFAATYDPDADASYIYVASDQANGDAVRQQHVHCDGSDGQIILDYDRDGRLLGMNYSEPRPPAGVRALPDRATGDRFLDLSIEDVGPTWSRKGSRTLRTGLGTPWNILRRMKSG